MKRLLGCKKGLLGALTLFAGISAQQDPLFADEPISLRQSWRGDVDFFATGVNLAADQRGVSGTVDTNIQPQSVTVRPDIDVPANAVVETAYLYWAGTRPNSDCVNALDNQVTLTVPGGVATSVIANECFCGEGTTSYDQQVCRFDMTQEIVNAGGQLHGDYTVSDFDASIADGATDNASFSVVLVYRHPSVGVRQVLLYDGIWELYESHVSPSHQELVLTESGFEVDNPATGSLTYYVIEGDQGGGGSEGVSVSSSPGNAPALQLQDAVNPANNPFNRTINTVSPARTDVIGVDIDRYDISSALTVGDTSISITYDGSGDKTWLIYNIASFDVFEPVFESRSTKTWTLHIDADNNGVPSPGDTVRYTLHLENTGNEEGTITVTDSIPSQFATSFNVVTAAGGLDMSTPSNGVVIQDLTVPVGESRDVIFDVVLAQVPDRTEWINVANYSTPPQGGAGGQVTSETSVVVRFDTDGDGFFDLNDNCPMQSNPAQANGDGDATGDICDPCPTDNPDDSDGDMVCDSADLCPGKDDRLDADNDSVPDACDICDLGDDAIDSDGDSVPDACDVCATGDDLQDADADNVPDACDQCTSGNDNLDTDGDGIPNACDTCEGTADADGDGVVDDCDICPEGDDNTDTDGDGIPDACDACNQGPDSMDGDNDDVPDACDLCPGADDRKDADGDTIPDRCDVCDSGDDLQDDDGDGIPDACDVCSSGDDAEDADGDGIPDACQVENCEDNTDNDGDGLADCRDPDCVMDNACGGSSGDPTPMDMGMSDADMGVVEDSTPRVLNGGPGDNCATVGVSGAGKRGAGALLVMCLGLLLGVLRKRQCD